jgi:hypothetical protein
MEEVERPNARDLQSRVAASDESQATSCEPQVGKLQTVTATLFFLFD